MNGMRPTKPHLTIISHNNSNNKSSNNNNSVKMDAVNWLYYFCLTLSFVVHITQSIQIDVNNDNDNNNTESIFNMSTINPLQDGHHFILNDTSTHDKQQMAKEDANVSEMQKGENSTVRSTERSRRLIPLMAFYLPITELPLNKQYALQMMSPIGSKQQQYEQVQMPDNDATVNGKFVVGVKGVDGNIARIAIPASYMQMKMSSFRSDVAPSIEENTHYASTPIFGDTSRHPNYRSIAYENEANGALNDHHNFPTVVAIGDGNDNGNTKLPRVVHVLSLKAKPNHHMENTFLNNIHHNNNNNNNHNNNNNNNNNGNSNLPYVSSLSASASASASSPSSSSTLKLPKQQQNPHKLKTVQYFPPIPSSTILPVKAVNTFINNNNNKKLTEAIEFLYHSQNRKNNVASVYRLQNINNNKQQQQQQMQQQQQQQQPQQQPQLPLQQQQQQQQQQHQSKNNLTPFTATNTIPGHFIPIIYTPINTNTNNENNHNNHNNNNNNNNSNNKNRSNNNNNNSNKYKRPSQEEPPATAAPTHIFLYDDEDDEILRQQAQYKHHYHHNHYHLQQQQQQLKQQQQQQEEEEKEEELQRPQNAIHYSATLPGADAQSSHNPNYYYRYQNNNKHLQQQQQHFSEISLPRLPSALSSINNLSMGKTFILSQNNFHHHPKLLITDGMQQVNFLNGSKQQKQQLSHHYNNQRQHQLHSKHFQPPRLQNFFDGQTSITKEENLHVKDGNNKVATQSIATTTYNIQQQQVKYHPQSQRQQQQQQPNQPQSHEQSSQSYISLSNEYQQFNVPHKESSHAFRLSSTLPSSPPLSDDTYSTTTIMPAKFPLSLQYSSARLLSPNNTPHHNLPSPSPSASASSSPSPSSLSSALPQYSKIIGLSTPNEHYANNVINTNAKQKYKQKPSILTPNGISSYVAVTTESPYQEVVTTFKPQLIQHHHINQGPFYETKIKLPQSPIYQLRRPIKLNNNDDDLTIQQQHNPLTELRTSSIKSDNKFDYMPEEFGKKLIPLKVTSKLKWPSNKPDEQTNIQSVTTMTLTEPLADPNDLPDIKTLSLTEILHKLQESNHLPQTLTPDNIDDSIKTLIRILNNLKYTQKHIKIDTAQHHNDIIAVGIHNSNDNTECVIDNGKQHAKQQSYKYENVTPKNLGAHSGRPGIDYPNYADIPETSFACSEQRYKGFFGDPETNCQVWHYCDLNGGKASFLCPNGTIFSQIALTCDWWFNVKCATTPQLYVLNERLYKYILPFTPKFPEDYNGPLVDKYLAMKFQEMEGKMRLENEKVNVTTSIQTENDLDDVDTTTIDENIEYTTQEIEIDVDKKSPNNENHSQKQLISEENPERNLLIDDEINDISQRIKEIHKFQSTTIGPTITTSNVAKISSTKSINEAFSLSMKPIVVLSSTIEPDYIEENGVTPDNHNDNDNDNAGTDIPDRTEQNSLNYNDDIIKATTISSILDEYKKIPEKETVNVTVEKVKLVEIKSDGTSGHLIPDILKK